jgi:hypothetical protein
MSIPIVRATAGPETHELPPAQIASGTATLQLGKAPAPTRLLGVLGPGNNKHQRSFQIISSYVAEKEQRRRFDTHRPRSCKKAARRRPFLFGAGAYSAA